jgi:hypothetical protein
LFSLGRESQLPIWKKPGRSRKEEASADALHFLALYYRIAFEIRPLFCVFEPLSQALEPISFAFIAEIIESTLFLFELDICCIGHLFRINTKHRALSNIIDKGQVSSHSRFDGAPHDFNPISASLAH